MGYDGPLITNRPLPSTEPLVPSSAKRNMITCSGCRCIFLQISATLAKTERLFPSRCIDGGARVYRFLRPDDEREGCDAYKRL